MADTNPNLRLATDRTTSRNLKMNFTRARLDAVRVPDGRDRVFVLDTGQRGLAYMKTAAGKESFYFYRKVVGESRRYPLADGSILIDDARKLVVNELARYSKGEDPRAERITDRKQLTVKQIFENWKNREGIKKRSIDQYEDNFECAIVLHNRKIDKVKKSDVASLHAKIGVERGHYMANRVLAILSIIFRWADGEYGLPVGQAVKGITKFDESPRARFILPDELSRFMKAIENEPDPMWKDYWHLLLDTGARRDNVCGMRWEDVDLIGKTWRIPAYTAKGKKMYPVPLSDESLTILKDRKKVHGGKEWVFPSYSKTGRLMEPKAAWERLLKRAKITNLRIHDVRRTVGSYMAQSGVSDRLIGAALGQTTQQATNVYAKLREKPIREARAIGSAAMKAAQAEAEAEAKKTRKRRPKT